MNDIQPINIRKSYHSLWLRVHGSVQANGQFELQLIVLMIGFYSHDPQFKPIAGRRTFSTCLTILSIIAISSATIPRVLSNTSTKGKQIIIYRHRQSNLEERFV